MFLKIKLEPTGNNFTGDDGDASFLEIADDDTIAAVKIKIKDFVHVSAEHQEIRTLTKTYNNHEKVYDIWQAELKSEGASIMLYELGRFVCFLQLYNKEEADMQRKYQEKSKSPTFFCKSKPTSTTQLVTLLSESEHESSETDSSDSATDSTTGTDKSSDSERTKKKRKLPPANGVQAKISKMEPVTTTKLSSTLRTYLHEFPEYSQKEGNNNNDLDDDRANIVTAPTHKSNDSSSDESDTLKKRTTYCAGASQYQPPATNKKVMVQISETTSTSHDEVHPCVNINPEMRKFIIVVSMTPHNFTSQNCEQWLRFFFERFHQSQISPSLQFAEKNSVTLFHGNLFIACDDKTTADWIVQQTGLQVNYYQAQSIETFLQLQKCVVVLPSVGTLDLCKVFALLEQQNKNLSCQCWLVDNRRMISDEHDDFFDSSVSGICDNEILWLLIDKQTVELLQQLDFKLKYCFWKISFKMN